MTDFHRMRKVEMILRWLSEIHTREHGLQQHLLTGPPPVTTRMAWGRSDVRLRSNAVVHFTTGANMAVTLTRYRFSAEDYDEMIDFGIIEEDERVELIRGEIVHKMPIGKSHIAVVNRLTRLLIQLIGDHAQVSVQNPIRLNNSEPEPDVSLLRFQDDFYDSAKPVGGDVLLVIEVSDASLETDRDIKRELYAEASIVEYWIVNLIDGCVEVHRQPQPNGTYSEMFVAKRGDTIPMVSLPQFALKVDQILG